jgi:hypothetical protein
MKQFGIIPVLMLLYLFPLGATAPDLWSLAQVGEIRSVRAAPPTGQAGGALRGSPEVTYTTGATAPRADPPAGARLRIYTVTSSDGKSLTIHGFNKSGYTLALASDDRLARWGGRTRFGHGVAFSDQYPNGTLTVVTRSGSGKIWVARGSSGDVWLSSWAYTTAPPRLPGDGKSLTILPTDLREGSDALWLNFQTDRVNGTSFLVVGAREKKDEADERDRQALMAADRFMKAVWKRDLEEVMKTVDLPFFWDGVENIKDRENLKSKLQRLVGRDRSKIEYKVRAVYPFAEWAEKASLRTKDHELLKEVLDKTDRIVVFGLTKDGIEIAVRVRGNEAKVVGFRD